MLLERNCLIKHTTPAGVAYFHLIWMMLTICHPNRDEEMFRAEFWIAPDFSRGIGKVAKSNGFSQNLFLFEPLVLSQQPRSVTRNPKPVSACGAGALAFQWWPECAPHGTLFLVFPGWRHSGCTEMPCPGLWAFRPSAWRAGLFQPNGYALGNEVIGCRAVVRWFGLKMEYCFERKGDGAASRLFWLVPRLRSVSERRVRTCPERIGTQIRVCICGARTFPFQWWLECAPLVRCVYPNPGWRHPDMRRGFLTPGYGLSGLRPDGPVYFSPMATPWVMRWQVAGRSCDGFDWNGMIVSSAKEIGQNSGCFDRRRGWGLCQHVGSGHVLTVLVPKSGFAFVAQEHWRFNDGRNVRLGFVVRIQTRGGVIPTYVADSLPRAVGLQAFGLTAKANSKPNLKPLKQLVMKNE